MYILYQYRRNAPSSLLYLNVYDVRTHNMWHLQGKARSLMVHYPTLKALLDEYNRLDLSEGDKQLLLQHKLTDKVGELNINDMLFPSIVSLIEDSCVLVLYIHNRVLPRPRRCCPSESTPSICRRILRIRVVDGGERGKLRKGGGSVRIDGLCANNMRLVVLLLLASDQTLLYCVYNVYVLHICVSLDGVDTL